MMWSTVVFVLALAAVSALPTDVLRKPDPGPRYQYVEAGDGSLHLADLWVKVSDVQEAARFNPDSQNVYHLFTRLNPTVSQPLLLGSDGLLGMTNYDARRRTIIIIHGWLDSATANVNSVLVPAFLAAEDVNVIVVDWSAGAGTINYAAAVSNTVTSGESVARFINWLNQATNTSPMSYHLVGHSLGGHQVGIIGRNVNGQVAYITALDPAFPLWITHNHKFREDDGLYTEIIHTNAGLLGYIGTLGHVDFYPNGGINMPGCDTQECDHERSFHYLAESLISGGFTGRRCATYAGAMSNNCILWGTLNMGGLVPKIGSSGIYRMETNASPPFSRG
ncbi:pancreatic triacylglycerol lipase-like [Pectinophora gossypiella]|uniref:pancreatic triacylglycerol lipase-like n=1 Tax=Pectinophora gossypiella TaxID=13191 RepID=UPI00214ED488|nr:pancreatic triacylglycerol lipase-like [Pectinophora gossypiella]